MKNVFIIIMVLIFNSLFSQESIPFSDRNNIPIINITINGKSANLLIDTGASKSFIDYRYDRKYNFDVLGLYSKINGIGSKTNELYNTKKIFASYNDIKINIDFKAMDLSKLRSVIGVIGVLGSDWFVKNNAVIDFKNKVIWVKK